MRQKYLSTGACMMHPGQAREAYGQKSEYWMWNLAHIAKKAFQVKTGLGIELNCTLKPDRVHNSIM